MTDYSLGLVWVVTPTLCTRASVGYVRERPKSQSGRNATRLGRLGTDRAFTLLGFSPQVVFVDEVRKTNAQLPGDSTRNRGELRFLRQF